LKAILLFLMKATHHVHTVHRLAVKHVLQAATNSRQGAPAHNHVPKLAAAQGPYAIIHPVQRCQHQHLRAALEDS